MSITIPATGSTPAGSSSSAAGTTLAQAYTPLAAGNQIIVFASAQETTAITVADNATGGSSTYTPLGSITNGTWIVAIFGCLSVKAGCTTITATYGTTGVQREIIVAEATGALAFGNTHTNTGSSTALTNSVTTQDSNNVVVCAEGINVQGTMTLVTGTKLDGTQFSTSSTLVAGFIAVASPGSGTVAFSSNVTGAWACAGVELRSVAPSAKGYSSYLPLFGRG